MSSVRTPVGPQPPAVYWRRRLLVLLGLVAVVVIIVLIIVRPGSQNAGAPTPTPTTSSSSASFAPVEEGAACNPAAVRIEPVTDSASYAAGVTPMISMSITNTGPVACTLDVGTSAQAYYIVSGSDPIWNSKDCQTGGEPFEQTLEPNVAITTTPFAWDRTRSDPGTCGSSRPAVVAGGATYRLSVAVGEIESAEDAPFILN